MITVNDLELTSPAFRADPYPTMLGGAPRRRSAG